MSISRRILEPRDQHRRGITEHLGRAAGNGHRVLEQADPPGQVGGTGHYNSPRGCTGDFVTTGNASASTIDATFDGIDCEDGSGVRLSFSGRIRVTKYVTVRIHVAGTCQG